MRARNGSSWLANYSITSKVDVICNGTRRLWIFPRKIVRIDFHQSQCSFEMQSKRNTKLFFASFFYCSLFIDSIPIQVFLSAVSLCVSHGKTTFLLGWWYSMVWYEKFNDRPTQAIVVGLKSMERKEEMKESTNTHNA